MRRSLPAILAVVTALAATPRAATTQEFENAIFHHSLLEVDAASSPGPTVGRWEAGGWIGTDLDRLWWSTDGERAGGVFGEAEAMLLYGHYARRFWDLVVGVRQDIEPVSQTYLAFGISGLAPYWFEVALLGFVSQEGRPSLRFEAENDLFLTQRLILQPSVHLDWLLTDDDRLDLDTGVSTLETGLRARYEIRRKFAPYVDVTWVREAEPRTVVTGGPEIEGWRLGAGLRVIY